MDRAAGFTIQPRDATIVSAFTAAGPIRRFLTNLIPQKYHGEMNGQQVCVFKQDINPFVLKLHLDFSMDQNRMLDRRLGIAAAVLLCVIEGRQN